MVHNAITNFANPTHSVLEEDSAQVPSWDIVMSGSVIHSVPEGMMRMKELLKIGKEDHTASQGGLHTWWERWFQTPPGLVQISGQKNYAHKVSTYVNILVVPGTKLLQCKGHRTFVVTGTQLHCVATTLVLGSSKVSQVFSFLLWPLSWPELGHFHFNYYIIIGLL